VLIVGMPSFGTLFTPAMTLVSEGAQHQRLDQGLAFGLGNLAWAAGQAVAAAGSGALAQATSDLVPYSLLAASCLVTLGFARIRRRPDLPPRVHPLRGTCSPNCGHRVMIEQKTALESAVLAFLARKDES
jgi:hypothetical protein